MNAHMLQVVLHSSLNPQCLKQIVTYCLAFSICSRECGLRMLYRVCCSLYVFIRFAAVSSTDIIVFACQGCKRGVKTCKLYITENTSPTKVCIMGYRPESAIIYTVCRSNQCLKHTCSSKMTYLYSIFVLAGSSTCRNRSSCWHKAT